MCMLRWKGTFARIICVRAGYPQPGDSPLRINDMLQVEARRARHTCRDLTDNRHGHHDLCDAADYI